VHHNLNETPLKLRTNSKLGSNDYVCIGMRNNVVANPQLYLYIQFYSKIYIRISYSDMNLCERNDIAITTLSLTQDRTWTITKTQISYQITGNDIEPLELTFNSLHCGKIAKTMNFGWLRFFIKLKGVSTVYHFVGNTSK
jgi:hypothetical protein